jgi:hypothetical protein
LRRQHHIQGQFRGQLRVTKQLQLIADPFAGRAIIHFSQFGERRLLFASLSALCCGKKQWQTFCLVARDHNASRRGADGR